ncbi:GNAT family N-acetyltransferase [Desulfosporosinus sp. SB140]|uniref:GNAT family N-acetyltransferase n=1 Tax=Desulfosporosinus paludis TaxID=3115649 RepID=UPI00388D2963
MFEFVVENEVRLKLLDVSHAEPLYVLSELNRSYLRQWLPWVDGTKSAEDTKSFIQMTRNQFTANNGFQAGIWYQGKIAGVIGFHNINWAHRTTSIGYWLGESYQGKGLMTKSCKALIEYAFAEQNLNRVEIRCAEKNFKSRSIPERLGFAKEGIIREAEWLYDHYVDHVVYGLLAREWNKKKSLETGDV